MVKSNISRKTTVIHIHGGDSSTIPLNVEAYNANLSIIQVFEKSKGRQHRTGAPGRTKFELVVRNSRRMEPDTSGQILKIHSHSLSANG